MSVGFNALHKANALAKNWWLRGMTTHVYEAAIKKADEFDRPVMSEKLTQYKHLKTAIEHGFANLGKDDSRKPPPLPPKRPRSN